MTYPKVSHTDAGASGVSSSPRFPTIEEAVLAYWEADGTFQASVDQRDAGDDGANEFVYILVFDGSRTVCLETLPLALAGEKDLAEFCHGTMQRLREDRCHPGTQIRVEFGFSRNFPTAA